MDKKNFTYYPWRYYQDAPNKPIKIYGAGKLVCTMPFRCGDSKKEVENNARILALAPEMLELLEKLYDALPQVISCENEFDEQKANVVMNAIAKMIKKASPKDGQE